MSVTIFPYKWLSKKLIHTYTVGDTYLYCWRYISILLDRDVELNPFTPGSGLRPPALEGRDDQIETFGLLVARSKRRNYDRGMILSGLRSVGKTSLLNYLAHHADNEAWLTISIEGRPRISGVAAVR